MKAYLAVIGHRSSQPIAGASGTPIDLTDNALPTSVGGTEAKRLFRALGNALREMRTRQTQAPTDATSPLRVGIIETAENGTSLDIHTASTDLRTLDLQVRADRETILRELRTLERDFVSDI